MTCIRKVLLGLLLNIPASLHAGVSTGSDNFSSGCATVEFMAKMVSVNLLLPAPRDSMRELESMQDMLLELNRLVCQSVILTSNTRHASRYGNGRLVSSDLYEAAWFFPNGQLFMAGAGRREYSLPQRTRHEPPLEPWRRTPVLAGWRHGHYTPASEECDLVLS